MTERTLSDLVQAADTLGVELHVHLIPKQPAKYRCMYCRNPMMVSAPVYDENPFCLKCLHERLTRTPDPLDEARLDCGLPLETPGIPEAAS
jgi:hypothetical protein